MKLAGFFPQFAPLLPHSLCMASPEPPTRRSSPASGWGLSAPAKMRSSQGRRCANSRLRLSRGSVAALGCIVYEVVKAHCSLSTALADAKADLAKAEATVESLVTAAKKAV